MTHKHKHTEDRPATPSALSQTEDTVISQLAKVKACNRGHEEERRAREDECEEIFHLQEACEKGLHHCLSPDRDFNHSGNFTAAHKPQQPGLIVNLQLLSGL